MIAEDWDAFHAALPRTGPLIGLDLGTETIGVAVSDGFRRFVFCAVNRSAGK